METNGDKKYIRSCESSAEVTNGEQSKCTSYKFFGQKNSVCACQTEYCNQGAAERAGAVSVVLAVGMLAKFYYL